MKTLREPVTLGMGLPQLDGERFRKRFPYSKFAPILPIILLFAVVCALQFWAGAYSAELGGYADEPSHYVSGVLIRDYLGGGRLEDPIGFARHFYLHYPYLAIGHWPPLFYAVESLWMLLFSTSRVSLIIFSAAVTALLAFTTYRIVLRDFGHFLGGSAALVFVCIPLVQRFSSMVMMDAFCALLSLWAVLQLASFIERGHMRDAVKFGLLAVLAILAKGNALYLAFAPLIAVVLTRRFNLLKRFAFWVPALMVGALAMPWHMLTMDLMIPTFNQTGGLAFVGHALVFYGRVLIHDVGLLLLCLALAGLYACTLARFKGRGVQARPAALAGLLGGMTIFYCTVPAGLETRYLIAALPPLLFFSCAGADLVARRLLPFSASLAWRRGVIFATGIIAFGVFCFAIPAKASWGFRAAVDRLVSLPDFRNSLTLVSSETPEGEGAFVAELAMRGRRQEHTVIRASKALANSDWNMTNYSVRFLGSEQVNSCLQISSIRFLVLDASPSATHYGHHAQLISMVQQYPTDWEFLGVFRRSKPSGKGPVYVYRSTHPGRPEAPLALARKNSENLNHWPIRIDLPCQTTPSLSLR